jgi:hypothetical protein
VPTGYELGLGVAVQSYDGKLFFGLTADAHVAPDVARLRDYIRTCFRELCKAAGIRSTVKPRRAKRTKPAARTTAVEPAPEPQAYAATAPADVEKAEPSLV